MNPSLLYVGTRSDFEIGADLAPDYSSAKKLLARNPYSVILFHFDAKDSESRDFINYLEELDHEHYNIVIAEKSSAYEILDLSEKIEIFHLLESENKEDVVHSCQEALKKVALRKQNNQILKLFHQQNLQLEQLSEDLEDRVKKRQDHLLNSREKLLETSRKSEAMHRAFIAVEKAKSIKEMESLLLEALRFALGLTQIKISLNHSEISQSQFEIQAMNCFKSNLKKEQKTIGVCYFFRNKSHNFLKAEKEFLSQVSEATSLAIDRLHSMQKSHERKEQWDATFHAISHPLVIIDENYKIQQYNHSFSERLKGEEVKSRKCYEVLFARKSPCNHCRLGENFNVSSPSELNQRIRNYHVRSKELSTKSDKKYYVQVYHDLTERQRVEKHILESAKLAELGLVGGSIAHELNSPLAGIISFLQIMKMDLTGKEDYYEDILEMEKGALRCKEIIQNLLHFTRKPSNEVEESLDLKEVIQSAVQIRDLQSRSMGICIHNYLPKKACRVKGNRNLFTQVILALLQNAHEAIEEKIKINEQHEGQIHIKLSSSDKYYLIDILDNGVGISGDILARVTTPLFTTKNPNNHRGLGLSLAYQILKDYSGDLEIFTREESGVQVRISLLREKTASKSNSLTC